MLSNYSIVVILAFLLTSCAGPQTEIDIDHNSPTEKQSEGGDDRGFDPCKLNSNLPVCKE